MSDRLPAWFFLAVALILIGAAQLPLVRTIIGLDETIEVQFFTVVMLFIGGLMSGLTAMILLVRRVPPIDWAHSPAAQAEPPQASLLVAMHGVGLLLYSGIPLLNFLVAYWLWGKYRHRHPSLDKAGRAVLNFQISIYLYLMLSLFMVIAIIGLVSTPLIIALHLLATLLAMLQASLGKQFNYPLNIPIIEGRQSPVE